MALFKKITIVGVGLLGGSIGLAIKKKKLAEVVTGHFRNKNKIAAAVRRGALDNGTDDFNKAIADSDLIILCSPVKDIMHKLKRLKNTKALITDTGSTKAAIAAAARSSNFVGAHPLAGSEQSGLSFAHADLFKGTLCILTPQKSGKTATKKIEKFWRGLGAKTILMAPRRHDRVLAMTSHLPHVAAFALAKILPADLAAFCAGGFRDTTRIALSNPGLWRDIFLTNKEPVLKSIAAFESSLKELRRSILTGDGQGLAAFLKKARQKRQNLP